MAHTLQQLDYSVLQQCMHCGMCLPTCPTYDTTKRERNSPRGRIALMRAVADGELSISREFSDEMSYCLGCLACQTACPAGVNYAQLFETARADIESSGINDTPVRILWRTLTLRVLFMQPRLLRFAGRMLRLYQRSGLEALVRRLGLTRHLPAALRRLEPQTPRICAKFSHQLIAEDEQPSGETRHRVALLTGCVQDLTFSDINRDTADVLLANGCAVHTPPVQSCCGSLHGHNGEPALAARLARRMIDLLPPDDYDAIITNAGGCGSHLRHYSALLAGDPAYAARAQVWDSKLRDIHEWLIQIGCRKPESANDGLPITVTYHESCHLTHGQKVTRQPRDLLRLLPGVELVELPESSWCCGSAGVYSITQPEQSALLLERKVRHIISTGADFLATSNPGCHLQIASGLKAAESDIQIVQPITLLARAYQRETASRPITTITCG
jgi:glycolate oxidase iron-sulfur subunit